MLFFCKGSIHTLCASWNDSVQSWICNKCLTQKDTPSSMRKEITVPQVPKLSGTVNRYFSLEKSLEALCRTKITQNTHKACICVICDSFIIGVEEIFQLDPEQIICKKDYLSVDYFQSVTGKIIPTELRNQYKIENNEYLSDLLLSPRAGQENGL